MLTICIIKEGSIIGLDPAVIETPPSFCNIYTVLTSDNFESVCGQQDCAFDTLVVSSFCSEEKFSSSGKLDGYSGSKNPRILPTWSEAFFLSLMTVKIPFISPTIIQILSNDN